MKQIPRCPFCKIQPVKSEKASSNMYLIPHKPGCLLKTLFNKIQDGQVEKWMQIGDMKELYEITFGGLQDEIFPYPSGLDDAVDAFNATVKEHPSSSVELKKVSVQLLMSNNG